MADGGVFVTISHMFKEGGFWMYPILGVQIVSMAIIAERVFTLFIKRKLGQERSARAFEGEIRRGQLESVIDKAKSGLSNTALGSAIQVGAQAAISFGGREEIQAKMDHVITKEQSRLEDRTEFLAMLGNVATLMGLLGTIVGMIRSFASIAQADEMAKATLLSAGIAEAMNATAYGLVTAIPALVMYSVLQNRASKLSQDLIQGATYIFNLLSFHCESLPVRASRSKKSNSLEV